MSLICKILRLNLSTCSNGCGSGRLQLAEPTYSKSPLDTGSLEGEYSTDLLKAFNRRRYASGREILSLRLVCDRLGVRVGDLCPNCFCARKPGGLRLGCGETRLPDGIRI